jgi:hypothetical protein
MTITHRVSKVARSWAACGAATLEWADDPTCFWCIVDKWVGDTSEIVRIIESNSMKDIQEAEDKRFIEDIER